MAILESGNFYYFLRVPGPFGLGHMGWGLQFSPDRWLFGSLENTGGSITVGPNGQNDYWWAWAGSEEHMFSEMRTMTAAARLTGLERLDSYTYYKRLAVRNSEPNSAERVALGQSGYRVTFNNCLDNAARVGDAYGVRVWSWSRHIPAAVNINISPRAYFFSTLHRYQHVAL